MFQNWDRAVKIAIMINFVPLLKRATIYRGGSVSGKIRVVTATKCHTEVESQSALVMLCYIMPKYYGMPKCLENLVTFKKNYLAFVTDFRFKYPAETLTRTKFGVL
jgi:hypothetical protein